MKEETIQRIAEQIVEVSKKACPPSDRPTKIAEELFREGRAYSLKRGDSNELTKIIMKLTKVWSEKYSEEYIRNQINKTIVFTIKNPDASEVTKIISKLDSEFESMDQENVVFLPVFGLVLPEGKFNIGNVIIYPGDEKKKGEILNKFIKAVRKTTSLPHKQDAVIDRIRISLKDAFKSHSIAEYKVVAEPIRAIERAEEETRRALEALRFAIPFLSPPERKIAIGLPDDAFTIVMRAFVISDDSFQYRKSIVRGLMPLELTSKCHSDMANIGIVVISELLQKKNLPFSDFEEALLNSIHWFSMAQLQPEIESSYLALITSIEALLSPRDRSPISNSIAEALAILIGKNVKDRRHIKKRFKELYGKRCAVSHGGDKAILENDYSELLHIAMEIIQQMIARKNEFTTRVELLRHIDEIKLS